MTKSKDPRITVVCTQELLEQLFNADTALKASRMKPEKKRANALHALMVQVTSARSKVPVVNGQFLQPPDSPEARAILEGVTPGPIDYQPSVQQLEDAGQQYSPQADTTEKLNDG